MENAVLSQKPPDVPGHHWEKLLPGVDSWDQTGAKIFIDRPDLPPTVRVVGTDGNSTERRATSDEIMAAARITVEKDSERFHDLTQKGSAVSGGSEQITSEELARHEAYNKFQTDNPIILPDGRTRAREVGDRLHIFRFDSRVDQKTGKVIGEVKMRDVGDGGTFTLYRGKPNRRDIVYRAATKVWEDVPSGTQTPPNTSPTNVVPVADAVPASVPAAQGVTASPPSSNPPQAAAQPQVQQPVIPAAVVTPTQPVVSAIPDDALITLKKENETFRKNVTKLVADLEHTIATLKIPAAPARVASAPVTAPRESTSSLLQRAEAEFTLGEGDVLKRREAWQMAMKQHRNSLLKGFEGDHAKRLAQQVLDKNRELDYRHPLAWRIARSVLWTGAGLWGAGALGGAAATGLFAMPAFLALAAPGVSSLMSGGAAASLIYRTAQRNGIKRPGLWAGIGGMLAAVGGWFGGQLAVKVGAQGSPFGDWLRTLLPGSAFEI